MGANHPRFLLMETIEQENKRCIDAWGKHFLGFNIPYFVQVANKAQVRLWGLLLEVDREAVMLDKVNKMHTILEDLIKAANK